MIKKQPLDPIDNMLFEACKELDLEGVKNALKLGANVNTIDSAGETALCKTVDYGWWKGVEVDHSHQEADIIKSGNYSQCLEIVQYLLHHGADIDLFKLAGNQPLVAAYYAGNYQMVKFLLENGSNPNINSWIDEDCGSNIQYRSSLLHIIDDLLYEEYTELDKEIVELARSKGGRFYDFDLNRHTGEHLGKSFVRFIATRSDSIFSDNSHWIIGDTNEITYEDRNDHLITFKLPEIPGLQSWLQDYRQHIDNPHEYDWKEWNQRGLKLAQEIANILPESIALHYYYGHNVTIRTALGGGFFIDPEKEDLYIPKQ